MHVERQMGQNGYLVLDESTASISHAEPLNAISFWQAIKELDAA